MSSTAYFAEIYPDPFLRRIVLASGALLALVGVPLIITLPVAPELRAAAVMTWLALAVNELSRVRRAWHACQALRFSADGTYDLQWGSTGSGDGQFAFPRGVAVSGAGQVYVTDYFNHRIQRFSADGTFETR